MNRFKRLFLLLIAFMLITPLFISMAAEPPQAVEKASPVLTKDDPEYGIEWKLDMKIPQKFTSHGLWFKAGDTVEFPENFIHKGDVFIAGATLKLKGFVKGNIFAAGANVILEDGLEVDGSVFIGAGSVDANAKITGTLYICAGEAVDESEVDGDVAAMVGGNCIMKGNYSGHVRMGGFSSNYNIGPKPYQSIDLKDKFDGKKGAYFGGVADELTISGKEIEIDEKAEIKGKVTVYLVENGTYKIPEKFKPEIKVMEGDPDEGVLERWYIKDLILAPIVAFLVGLLFLRFGRPAFEDFVANVRCGFGWTLLWGILPWIGVPIAFIIMLIIQLPVFLLFIFSIIFMVFLAYLGSIVIGYWIGDIFFNKIIKIPVNSYIQLLVGVVLFYWMFTLLCWIPYIGFVFGIIKFILLVMGFGAIVAKMFGKVYCKPA